MWAGRRRLGPARPAGHVGPGRPARAHLYIQRGLNTCSCIKIQTHATFISHLLTIFTELAFLSPNQHWRELKAPNLTTGDHPWPNLFINGLLRYGTLHPYAGSPTGFSLYLKNEIPRLLPQHIWIFSLTVSNPRKIILWHILHATTVLMSFYSAPPQRRLTEQATTEHGLKNVPNNKNTDDI